MEPTVRVPRGRDDGTDALKEHAHRLLTPTPGRMLLGFLPPIPSPSSTGVEWAVGVEWPTSTSGSTSTSMTGGGHRRKKGVWCSPALRRRLAPHQAALRRRLEESADPHSFLVELTDVLSKTGGGMTIGSSTAAGPRAQGPRSGEFYGRVVSEVDAVGWDKLISANDSLSRLSFQTRDAKRREHRLDLELLADYPRSAPVCTANLPQALTLQWNPAQSTLSDVVRQFEEALASYQDLWRVLEDIDNNTWVLEPERPTLTSFIRRIALGNHCSVQVVIDPAAPTSPPQCRFLGSEARVASLRENLNANIDLWAEAEPAHVNLARVLGCELPGKEAAASEDRSNIGCGICYALRLKGDIPTILCSLASCNKAFHETCLVEWLRVLPTTRQSFGTLFGACPYCSTQIIVKTRT